MVNNNTYKSQIKLDNIEDIEQEIKYKSTKFEKIITENKHLLPQLSHYILSFNIYKTKSSFVNAIRRCIIDELPTNNLYFNITDISTNDNFILNDLIQSRIQLISILQNINIDTKFSLNIHNKTTKNIPIYTNNIINSNNKDKTIYFNQNIKLCDLKPNRFININNIYIKTDYGLNNSSYNIGGASYEVINFDMEKNQSMSTDPSDFKFYVYNNGNIKSKDIVLKSIIILQKRLDHIVQLINNYDDLESNDELIINKTENLTLYHIKNEYHTLGNLIIDYMFELDTSTKLLNYNNDHSLKNEITIKTDNLESSKLIINAINNIQIDFKNIIDKF
mgnify:CR=1 FL=1